MVFQIDKLVIKYWFRIKIPSFSNTLVGEAAKACMELKLKPTIFLRYTLQHCEEEDSILQNEVFNLQTEIFKSEKSVCHYVKRGLQNVFMRYWGEQFQPDKNGGKLRIFKM